MSEHLADTNIETSLTKWQPRFFTIWIGQAFSLLGSSLVHFALVWWLTEETGSATILATATLIATLPQIFVGPFAGALVDRWDRRAVMMVSDSAIALATLGLLIINWMGVMQPWHVYAILLLRSLGGAFQWPAMQASTSLLVPKAQLARVAGMNQMLNGGMNIIAPPLGAYLLGVVPLHGVLAVDVTTALLAVGPLFFLIIPQPERASETSKHANAITTLLRDVQDGFKYMWNWTGLFVVCIMAAVINLLLNPAFSLMPILVTQHFGGDAIQLGWINSVFGIGVILGGLTLSAWGGFKRRIFTSMLGLMGMGIGIMLIGFAPASAFWLAMGGMFIGGFMNPLTNGPLFAVLQDVVAPDMQGRVFTVLNSMATLISPFGLAVAGPLADSVGASVWFVIGGLGCLAMGVVGLFIPAVIHLEETHNGEAATDSA